MAHMTTDSSKLMLGRKTSKPRESNMREQHITGKMMTTELSSGFVGFVPSLGVASYTCTYFRCAAVGSVWETGSRCKLWKSRIGDNYQLSVSLRSEATIEATPKVSSRLALHKKVCTILIFVTSMDASICAMSWVDSF
eukprot:3884636-Amphidinium_carterae.1